MLDELYGIQQGGTCKCDVRMDPDGIFFQMVLVKSREQVADELNRLQRDNESLQGKHKLHVELQQQEGFHMPDNVQVCDSEVLNIFDFYISNAWLYVIDCSAGAELLPHPGDLLK